MASSSEHILEDLQRVVGELESLAKGATTAAGECASDAAERLNDKIEQARDRLWDVEKSARKNAERGFRVANRYVRDNTWQSLGAVAAIAFIAGLVLGWRD